MFPVFFDPRVLRNREKTGPGDQTLAKSYDIGKLTSALRQLIRACQEQAPDCSDEEIAYFIHEKGQLTRGKGTRIQNRIGFLIDAVPKCFAGDAIRLYRELRMEQPTPSDEEGQEERDRAWGREHQAELNDPNVPEEIKPVIRRCLGTNDGA
jgi:hypothetical protein